MRPPVGGALWTAGYALVVSAPLVAALLLPRPPGLGYAWDLSMGLGIAALSVMLAQSLLTARLRRVGAPFGIDILYYVHRWMGVGGLVLVLGHWGVLRLGAPEVLVPAMPGQAPVSMTAGRASLLAIALLIAFSLGRRLFRIEYDRWRILHVGLALVGVALAAIHVAGSGGYTRAPAVRGLLLGYGAGWLALFAWVRLGRPALLARRPWRVVAVRPERGRSWTVEVEPEGHPGLRFEPGQFAWLTLRASPFAAREHPFSFSGSAAAAPRLSFTIRELGDFTSTVGDVRPGEIAYVDGPYGGFTVDRHPGAPGFGFVAGGVGVAPIMSMLRTMADRGERRPLGLLYANDRWEDVLFREELAELQSRLDLRIEHVLVDPPEAWTGPRGYVRREVLQGALPPGSERWTYFVCGPRPLGDATEAALRALGVPLARIQRELFEMA